MRFLVDANLSPRVAAGLISAGFDSALDCIRGHQVRTNLAQPGPGGQPRSSSRCPAASRFKDQLHEEHPGLLPAWHAFRDARATHRAVQWLADNSLIVSGPSRATR